MYPFVDLLDIYTHKDTTIKKVGDNTIFDESNNICYIHGITSFLRFGTSSPTQYTYDGIPSTVFPIHEVLTHEIRTHTFILDNVYGREGIHTVSKDIWINTNHSWYTFDSMETFVIPPNSTIIELEKHTYIPNKNSPLALCISIVVYGHMSKSNNHPMNHPMNHPVILSCECIPLHKYTFSSTEIQEEYKQLIQALTTI